MNQVPAVSLNPAAAVYRHACTQPRRTAVVVGGRSHDYGDLASKAVVLANLLPPEARGGRVGILTARGIATYAGILGACWAGATYVPMNVKLPAARLKDILRMAKLAAVIVDDAGQRRLGECGDGMPPTVLAGAALDAAATSANGGGEPAPPVAVAPDHTAYLMYTSGTTGIPKGVAIGAASLRAYIDRTQAIYSLTPDDRVSQFSEVSFDFSVLDLFVTWEAGAALHVVPESQLLAPARFIQEHALTFWASVPSVILFLERLKLLSPGAFPSLRVTYFCGEPLAVSSARAWQRAAPNSAIDNHYGPTEATVACSFERFSEHASITPTRQIVGIGRPYPGMRMAVVDEAGHFLPPGVAGELVLSGVQVAQGYFGDQVLTGRCFPVLSHPEFGQAVWYRTGDSAVEDSSGGFHHLGRLDHQVKILGNRIELEEVEAHLRQVCGCDSVAAVAWPIVEGSAEGLVAFFADSPCEPSAVFDGLKRRVPAYMMPRHVIRLDRIPLSVNGKIDRKALLHGLEQGDYAHLP